MHQGTRAQPVDQFATIRRTEDVVEGITAARMTDTCRHREQMQFVVSQHSDSHISQSLHETQHFQRTRTTIDEIAGEP
jgi:hypothetical protein